MKVAVVGTLLWDTIHSWRGPSREGPGGIAYNVTALACLHGPEDRVLPVSWLGGQHLASLRANWKDLIPPLDLGHVHVSPGGSDTNELRYTSPTARQEAMTLRCPPLDPDMLGQVTDADLIHFNAITGREFCLRTVQSVAAEARGLLMLDVHCLVCRLSKEGRLTRGAWQSWREWATHFDLWQCNEEELALMHGTGDQTLEGVARGAAATLQAGPECVIVTLGSRGSLVATRQDSRTLCWHTPGLTPSMLVDPTGCGDSFSAGFICGYLRWKDPRRAAVLGTVAAAVNCEAVGSGAFNGRSAGRPIWDSFAREEDSLRQSQTMIELPR